MQIEKHDKSYIVNSKMVPVGEFGQVNCFNIGVVTGYGSQSFRNRR